MAVGNHGVAGDGSRRSGRSRRRRRRRRRSSGAKHQASPTFNQGERVPWTTLEVVTSAQDFVEVIQGGSLASDVVVELKNFVVPSDGYMMVEFLDSKLFLCPGIVYDLQVALLILTEESRFDSNAGL